MFYFRARVSGKFSPRVIGRLDEIPVGGSKIFVYPTDVEPCILLRPSQDEYLAYSRLCTHASCHGGSFSVADGSVLQGPPPRPLPRILLEKQGSEIVAVGVANG